MPSDSRRRHVAMELRLLSKYAYPPDYVYELLAYVMGRADDISGTGELFALLADLIDPDTTSDTTADTTKSAEDTTKAPTSSDTTSTHTDVTATCDVSQSRRSDVDREALLALAEDMDELCGPWHDCGEHYARLIREACGVVG